MNYLFHSNDNMPDKQLTLEQIKTSFLLVIKSPTKVIFTVTALDQEWVADNLNDVLGALNIRIEEIPNKNKDKKGKNEKGTVEIGGDVTGSNIVIGSNNAATNICNGVSYMTVGDNLKVGP